MTISAKIIYPDDESTFVAQYFTVHPADPQPRLMRQTAQIIGDGGVIAYPTDSSYALGCRLDDIDAANRMRAIRGVDHRHLLTLVCGDLASAGRHGPCKGQSCRTKTQAHGAANGVGGVGSAAGGGRSGGK